MTHKQSATSFDCYEAETRDEVVPASYVTLSGGTSYNNFDTDKSKMYTYAVDVATDIPGIVSGQYGAGRMQHGDFKWSFDNAVDDASSAVNTALKSAITNYTSQLVGVFGDTSGGDGDVTVMAMATVMINLCRRWTAIIPVISRLIRNRPMIFIR